MNALEKLSQATQMLSEVRSAEDAKKLMDLAASAEYYATKAKLGEEAIGYAHTIRIDAMRLLGGFLKTAEKNPGARGIGPIAVPDGNRNAPPTLAALGLTKKESSQSQLLDTIAATLPEEFAHIRDGQKTVTAVRREVERVRVKEASPLPECKYRVQTAELNPLRMK